MAKKTVYIIDDHPMFRRGLAASINAEPDLMVCGESAGDNGCINAVREKNPDLIVLDVSLQSRSGIDLLRELMSVRPESLVLVVSMHDEALYAERALRAGARGYIMKHEEPEKMLRCLRQLLQGQVYLSDSASTGILQNLTGQFHKGSRFAVDQLSDREFEVFELLGHGRTTNEIAEQLRLNVRTVVVHCANIRKKLNVRHSSELLAYAVQWKQSGGGR